MKFNQLLLATSSMALMILPACNWWGSSKNESDNLTIEEVLVMEPEAQLIESEQLEEQGEINDLNLLDEK